MVFDCHTELGEGGAGLMCIQCPFLPGGFLTQGTRNDRSKACVSTVAGMHNNSC